MMFFEEKSQRVKNYMQFLQNSETEVFEIVYIISLIF